MEDENDAIEGSAEESKKYKDLGKIDKLGKSLGVESRWRYRLTNCQRSQTCGKSKKSKFCSPASIFDPNLILKFRMR